MSTQRKEVKQEPQPRGKAMLIWDVPENLRKRFRIACIQRGTTMRQVITDFMARYAERK